MWVVGLFDAGPYLTYWALGLAVVVVVVVVGGAFIFSHNFNLPLQRRKK